MCASQRVPKTSTRGAVGPPTQKMLHIFRPPPVHATGCICRLWARAWKMPLANPSSYPSRQALSPVTNIPDPMGVMSPKVIPYLTELLDTLVFSSRAESSESIILPPVSSSLFSNSILRSAATAPAVPAGSSYVLNLPAINSSGSQPHVPVTTIGRQISLR